MRRLLKELEEKKVTFKDDEGETGEGGKEEGEGEEGEEGEVSGSTSGGNLFDLLGEGEDDTDENLEESEVIGGSGEPEEMQKVSKKKNECRSGTTGKKKKNKNKKGKGKGVTAGEGKSGKVVRGVGEEQEDSLDKILRELAVNDGFDSKSTEGTSQDKMDGMEGNVDGGEISGSEASRAEILGVDVQFLRADDELRRIFGSKMINAAERREEVEGGSGRRRSGPGRRGGVGGGHNRVGLTLKKLLLVQPMDHWMRWDGGLTMECVRSKGGFQYFQYVQSSSYLAVQSIYEDCVATHDPNTIARLLGKYPYHVDSLLALADVYRSMGEYQNSADLLERCLYALESAWHPWFNPRLGTCRLEYKIDENKQFFHALFRHMQHLTRRGCHRTALQVCKLLLSLDPEDPLGARFCIDYYALRGEQYEWLEKFVVQYSPDGSLSLFPNFSFSSALARFHSEALDKEKKGEEKKGGEQGRGGEIENSRMEVEATSQELLQQALLLHPLMLKKLVDKAPIKVDAHWAKILKHKLFAFPEGGGPSVEHLIELYLQRSSILWRAPDVQVWLRDVSLTILEMADRKGGDNGEISCWKAVRKEAFPSEVNEYRHLFLADFTDSIATLPPEEVAAMREAMGDGRGRGRGMPRAEMMMGPPQGREGEGGAPPLAVPEPQALDPAGQNALMVFLQALLPWNDFGVDPERGGEGGGEGDARNEQGFQGERRDGGRGGEGEGRDEDGGRGEGEA